MKYYRSPILAAFLFAASLSNSSAQTAPALNDAASFAVLGSSTVTSTGPTVITGNVGVSPGSAVTGFPPATITNGAIFSGAPSNAGAAQTSATSAYNNLKGQTAPPANDLTGKVLGETVGAITLTPGIYSFTSSAQLNATLTLNDGGDPNAVFIFNIESTLTTASYSKVVMSSGGNGPNVFWRIGSSATIGTYTAFVGNIIALASITMTTGATTSGRLFALNGAVTMDTNTAYASSEAVAPVLPDLRPLFVMVNKGFVKSSVLSRPLKIEVFNVGSSGSSTSGAVSVYLSVGSNFSVTLDGSSSWLLTDNNGGEYTLTSSASISNTSPPTSSDIALILTAKTTATKGNYNIQAQIADNAGGETNNANNGTTTDVNITTL